LVTGGQFAYASLCDLTADDPAGSYTILPSMGGPVGTAVFSPDSKYILTAAEPVTGELASKFAPEPIARVWDLSGTLPQKKAELRGHTDVILDAAFLGRGSVVATSSFDKTVRIWSLEAETESSSTVLRGHDGAVFHLAATPDGNVLASAGQDGSARLWHLADLIPSPARLSAKKAQTLSISSDGRWLFAGGPSLSRWDLKAARPSLSLETRMWALGLAAPSTSALSRKGRWLITRFPTQNGDLLVLWDLQKGLGKATPVPIKTATYDIKDVVLTDDWLIVVVNRNKRGELELWDLNASTPENKAQAFGLRDIAVTAIAATPDRSQLALAAADHTLHLAVLRPGRFALESVANAGSNEVREITFSPSAHWLVVRGDPFVDHTVRLWNVNGNSLAPSPVVLGGHNAQLLTVIMSPDDRFVLTAAIGEPAFLWKLDSKNLVGPRFTLAINAQIPTSAEFSSDGRWLMTASYRQPSQLWDLSLGNDTPSHPAYLRGHTHPLIHTRFTPDSHWLITADNDVGAERERDRTCRLWDLTARDPAASAVLLPKSELPFGADSVNASPGGHWLITNSADGVRVWHLGTSALIGLAQATAGRDLTDDERRLYDLPLAKVNEQNHGP